MWMLHARTLVSIVGGDATRVLDAAGLGERGAIVMALGADTLGASGGRDNAARIGTEALAQHCSTTVRRGRVHLGAAGGAGGVAEAAGCSLRDCGPGEGGEQGGGRLQQLLVAQQPREGLADGHVSPGAKKGTGLVHRWHDGGAGVWRHGG
jgi:hypothetical protein